MFGAAAALAASSPGVAVQAQQPGLAAPLTLTCPARLETGQSASNVPGWESYRSPKSAGRLDSHGFYDGPVASDYELAPNGGSGRGRVSVATYRFIANRNPIHFACRYRGTDMVLTRALPPAVRQCSVTSGRAGASVANDRIVCR